MKCRAGGGAMYMCGVGGMHMWGGGGAGGRGVVFSVDQARYFKNVHW